MEQRETENGTQGELEQLERQARADDLRSAVVKDFLGLFQRWTDQLDAIGAYARAEQLVDRIVELAQLRFEADAKQLLEENSRLLRTLEERSKEILEAADRWPGAARRPARIG